MEKPFSIEAQIKGERKNLTVIPQQENFLMVTDGDQTLTFCFNCDFQCSCVDAQALDEDSLTSIANAIDLHYMLRED